MERRWPLALVVQQGLVFQVCEQVLHREEHVQRCTLEPQFPLLLCSHKGLAGHALAS